MSIKKRLLENALIEDLWYFKRMRQDKNLKNWVRDYDNSKSTIKFEELGFENKEKLFFLIEFDKPEMGFFACWRFGLAALAFAERYKLEPIIDWSSQSPYYEKNGLDGIFNPFEYYFEPTSDVSISTLNNCYNVARYGKNTVGNVKIEYNDNFDVEFWAELVKKYYILRTEIKEKIYKEINSLLGGKKILAVQIRGVEWGKIKDHPIPVSLEKYTDEIDLAIKQCGFEQIFLATDSEDTVEYISNRYPDKVVVYKDVARASKGSKTLAIFDNSIKRENNNFRLGYEVLRDMLTLSECSGLIATYSNISFAAEVTKFSNNKKYEYKKIVKTEINKNGITAEKAVIQMKKNKFNK